MRVSLEDPRSALVEAGLPNGALCEVTILGVRAWILYELCGAEAERRRLAGLGAVRDRDLLKFLWRLPVAEPVETAGFTPRERRLLRDAPPGTIDVGPGTIARLINPALVLVGVVVVDHDWDRGLNRASVFAAFGPRMLLYRGATEPAPLDLVEAEWYGIGVAAIADTERVGVRVLVQPDLSRPRFGPVSWSVAETIYDAVAADLLNA